LPPFIFSFLSATQLLAYHYIVFYVVTNPKSARIRVRTNPVESRICIRQNPKIKGFAQHLVVVVLLRIQGLGFTLWPFFARERKSGSSRQGFESLLPGKKHPKWPEISHFWHNFFLSIVFSAILRVHPFGVFCNYCYGSFLWNLGIRFRFKSFS
jgi:hypothetical protein